MKAKASKIVRLNAQPAERFAKAAEQIIEELSERMDGFCVVVLTRAEDGSLQTYVHNDTSSILAMIGALRHAETHLCRHIDEE